jgi:cytochrome c-type biogenesis protein CcmH
MVAARLAAVALLAGGMAFGDETRLRNLQSRFIAPCCWSEPVSVHRSPLADEMRGEIAKMIASGKTDDEIVTHFVGQYGERVLMAPRGPRSIWLTVTPFVALALAGAWLIRYLTRRKGEQTPSLQAAAPVRDEDLEW